MDIPQWSLPAAVSLLFIAIGSGCGMFDDDEPIRSADILREYEDDYRAMRQRLAEVPALLPSDRVDESSCAADASPTPPPVYRTDGFNRPDGNTEVAMEPYLTDPDAELGDYSEQFKFGMTDLLDAVRWTGPHGPLGDGAFEFPAWEATYDEDSGTHLREQLDRGLATRYLVVVRVIEYTPPDIESEYIEDFGTMRDFIGNITVDGFVVDLQQSKLMCSFTAEGDAPSFVTWVPGTTADSATEAIYYDLREDIGFEVVDILKSLGGDADVPGS